MEKRSSHRDKEKEEEVLFLFFSLFLCLGIDYSFFFFLCVQQNAKAVMRPAENPTRRNAL